LSSQQANLSAAFKPEDNK